MRPTISRRMLLGGSVVAAGTAALSGCGGAASGDGTTLNVWGGVPGENGPQAVCDAFVQANPGTSVTYTRFVNDDQGNIKLDTSLQGGAAIDVFFTHNGPALLTQRTDAGLALDLTDRIAADAEMSKFAADADPLYNVVRDGSVYSVPVSAGVELVLINVEAFDRAGIDLPKQWSIEDYRRAAQELSGDGVFGAYDTPPMAKPAIGPDYLYTADGMSNFAHPAFRADLDLALAMQSEGSTLPMETILAEKLEVYQHGPFLQGRFAMVAGGVLHLLRYISDTEQFPHDFTVAAVPMPHPDTEDYFDPGSLGDMLSVSADSANPDLAWEFVRFYTLNAGEYVPGRPPTLLGNSTPDSLTAQLLGPDMDELYLPETFTELVSGSEERELALDTKFTASLALQQIQAKLSEEVLLGARTVDSWATEAVRQADAAIQQST